MNELQIGNYYKSIWGSEEQYGIIRYDNMFTDIRNSNYVHDNYVYLSCDSIITSQGAGSATTNEWKLCTEEEIRIFEDQFEKQFGNKKNKKAFTPLIFN